MEASRAYYGIYSKEQRIYVQEAYKHTPRSDKGKSDLTHSVQIYVLPKAFVSFSNTVSREEMNHTLQRVNQRMPLIL